MPVYRQLCRMTGCLFLAVLCSRANAASIPIANASFENPMLPDGAFTDSLSVPNWTVTGGGGGAGVYNPNFVAYTVAYPSNGAQVAWTSGPVISQVLGTSLAADTIYMLRVDAGSPIPDFGDRTLTGYRVQLLAGGQILAEGESEPLPLGVYTTAEISYRALSSDPLLGQSLEIRLGVTTPVGNDGEVDFDTVRLDAVAVPELASSTLALLGAMSFFGLRRAEGLRTRHTGKIFGEGNGRRSSSGN